MEGRVITEVISDSTSQVVNKKFELEPQFSDAQKELFAQGVKAYTDAVQAKMGIESAAATRTKG